MSLMSLMKKTNSTNNFINLHKWPRCMNYVANNVDKQLLNRTSEI